MRRTKLKAVYSGLPELTRDLFTILNNEPTFSLVLTTGTSVTTVTNQLVGKNSFIDFMPESSAAATVKQSMWISSRGDGNFDLSHSTQSGTISFTYFIHG